MFACVYDSVRLYYGHRRRRAAGERLLARAPRARRINPFVRAAWGAAGRTNEKKKKTKPSPSPVRLTGGVRAAGVGRSACIYVCVHRGRFKNIKKYTTRTPRGYVRVPRVPGRNPTQLPTVPVGRSIFFSPLARHSLSPVLARRVFSPFFFFFLTGNGSQSVRAQVGAFFYPCNDTIRFFFLLCF